MEFKSSHPRYSTHFIGHLKRFVEEYNLFTTTDKLLIAVSGGIDSMALLFAMIELKRYGYSNRVRVIHINHNSRPGQIYEQELVQRFCS